MATLGFTQYGTGIINGQFRTVVQGAALYPPAAMQPLFRGNGAPAPTLPLPIVATGGADGMGAASQPFSLKASPVPWLVVLLIVGLLGLRYVHWRPGD